MLDVFTITLPIYLIIALGFISVKTGMIGAGITDHLVQFVVKLAIPLMVFFTITTTGAGNVLNPNLMFAYCILILVFLVGGRTILKTGLHHRPGQSWSLALGIANPNTIMIGLPLATAVFPDQVTTAFTSFLLVENIIAIPLSLLAAEMAGRAPRSVHAAFNDVIRSFAKNAILIAVVAALIARVFGYAPSGPIETTIKLLGQTAPALALFYIGAVCTQFRFSGPIGTISVVASLKLIAMPATAAFLFPMLLDDPALIAASILMTSIPMLTIFPMLARKSDSEELAATLLIITTTASFFTVSATLMLL
ncbi:MAG: AEC family transporter [Paracoccaceae bacterium]|jgi:malonate transporter and related proteins|nr:AEC family transporter [Paracoccaceae bacterium]